MSGDCQTVIGKEDACCCDHPVIGEQRVGGQRVLSETTRGDRVAAILPLE